MSEESRGCLCQTTPLSVFLDCELLDAMAEIEAGSLLNLIKSLQFHKLFLGCISSSVGLVSSFLETENPLLAPGQTTSLEVELCSHVERLREQKRKKRAIGLVNPNRKSRQ